MAPKAAALTGMVVAYVLLAPAPPAWAAGAERRLALVIGNDAYRAVPALRNARTDARAVAQGLQGAGFSVTLRLDLDEKGMKEALRTFKGQVAGGDVAVVYFAGHGVQLGGANFLLPVDVRGESEEQVRDEAIPLQRVLDDLQDQRAAFSLAIVDACRNNPFKGAGRAIGGRGLAVTAASRGQMVIFSAGAGQEALDNLGPADTDPNGVFTRVLLREMGRPGVPVDRMLRTVRQEVVRLAASAGREQVPALYDQSLGDFFFVAGDAPAVVPAPVAAPHPARRAGVRTAPLPTPAETRLMDAMRVHDSTQPVLDLAKPLAAKGSVYGRFAIAFYDDDSVKERKALEQGARDGIPLAMVYLARAIARGASTPEDSEEIRSWLDLALELGEPLAKIEKGVQLALGKLGPRDTAGAERLFAEGTLDCPDLCPEVGHFYWVKSEGVIPKEESDPKGLAYWRKSALRGDIGSMALVGQCYMNGVHVARDIKEGLRWTEEAAQGGDVPAMMDLGLHYAWGEEDTHKGRDGEKAVHWFSKAAEKGDTLAVVFMADMYREGRAVPKDLPRALQLYRNLAEDGVRDAMVHLGEMYEKGEGVPQDWSEAYFWFVLGWDNVGWEFGPPRVNPHLAAEARARIEARAAAWRRSRAERGRNSDQYRLGEMYEKGLGVPRDLSKAYFWYILAGPEWPWGRQKLAGQVPTAERASIEAQAKAWKPKGQAPAKHGGKASPKR